MQSDTEKVVSALRTADWSGASIGNKAIILAAIQKLEELDAEGFALSAGVCPHKLGNEHGNAYCGKTNELI